MEKVYLSGSIGTYFSQNLIYIVNLISEKSDRLPLYLQTAGKHQQHAVRYTFLDILCPFNKFHTYIYMLEFNQSSSDNHEPPSI